MKKLSLITLVLFLGLSCVLYTACKKEQKNGTSKKSGQRVLSGGPTLDGDLLAFGTIDEYDAFQDYLMSEVNKSDGTLSDDEILQEIEDALGFTSLRKIAAEEFERLNVKGWSDPRDIPEEHWITSKITRAVLNKDREVKIGDQIVHYVNENYMVTVAADRPEMISALKALPLTATLEDILDIDLSRHYLGISNLKTHEFFDVVPFGPFDPGGHPLKPWYLNGYAEQFNPCAASLAVTLSGLELWDNLNSLPNKGMYTIDWGDGSAPTVIPSSTGIFGTIVPPLTKSYSSPGIKTITVSVAATSPSSSGGMTVITRTFTVNLVDVPMCTDFAKMDTRDYSLGATTFLRGHIKYDAWYSILHHRDECKILSYTECYVTDDGVNWHRFRANWITLCSRVGTWPEDSDCNPITSYELFNYNCASNTYTRYSERNSIRFHWKTHYRQTRSFIPWQPCRL